LIDEMEFFGETFFSKKVSPNPFQKTSHDWIDKESADLKKQNGCKFYSNCVPSDLHFLCLSFSFESF